MSHYRRMSAAELEEEIQTLRDEINDPKCHAEDEVSFRHELGIAQRELRVKQREQEMFDRRGKHVATVEMAFLGYDLYINNDIRTWWHPAKGRITSQSFIDELEDELIIQQRQDEEDARSED